MRGPSAMTAAGRIQNYLGKDPDAWSASTAQARFASRSSSRWRRFRDRFSVVNGVHMAPSFDGHLQNMNFLFTGDPFGGDFFVPHLNLAETGREPEIARRRPADRSGHNVAQSFRRHPVAGRLDRGLSDYLRRIAPAHPEDELMGFVRAGSPPPSTARDACRPPPP